jgi:CRP-like cAMP-binding protein
MRTPPLERPDTVDLGEVPCEACPVGCASGRSAVQFCPFIIRHYERGAALCSAGDPADYVWLVKDGVIGLGAGPDEPDRLAALRLPGSYIGLECLLEDRYRFNARAMSRATLCGATRDGFLRWVRGSDERLRLVVRTVMGDPLLNGTDTTTR